MRRARNTRVVVTNRLFAFPDGLLRRQCSDLPRILAQIVLDSFLILRGRWNNPGGQDEAVLVERITMIKDAARRFGDCLPDSVAQLSFASGPRRRLILARYAQRFGTREYNLNRPHHNAPKRIPYRRHQACPTRRLPGDSRQSLKIEVESRE